MYAFSLSVPAPTVRARATASRPFASSAGVGGYQIGWYCVIATPHHAIPQRGSIRATWRKAFSDSSYQKEWSMAVARSNCRRASSLHETGKSTRPSSAVSASECPWCSCCAAAEAESSRSPKNESSSRGFMGDLLRLSDSTIPPAGAPSQVQKKNLSGPLRCATIFPMPSYGQFCPVAKAAEVFAERWTPLIVRELLRGSLRFSDLQRGV